MVEAPSKQLNIGELPILGSGDAPILAPVDGKVKMGAYKKLCAREQHPYILYYSNRHTSY
jgi:hypothetical protein